MRLSLGHIENGAVVIYQPMGATDGAFIIQKCVSDDRQKTFLSKIIEKGELHLWMK
jgi:hypothetical protein